MKKPYFRALLGATVVSAFAAMATPAVAQTATGPANPAAGPPSGAACSLNDWAQACFVPAGDVVWVRDARKDGHHADVHFWWGSKPWKPAQTCHDQLGKKAGWTYCSGFSRMIPENTEITLWPMEVKSNESVVSGSGGSQIHSSTS